MHPRPYIQRASPRVRRLFHWANDEPEPPEEAERTASVNLHVPCGLVPQSTQPGITRHEVTTQEAMPSDTVEYETTAPCEVSPPRPCLRSPRQGSEQETQGTPRPRAEGSPPRQVRFQLPATTEAPDDGLRRSSRTRRPPQWLSDYEM